MGKSSAPRIVVIGAGVGGLSAAARLARQGLDVTVLEAQVYPGGCASTFYHQGYRFEAGATLAGGFSPGGPMARLAEETGVSTWPGRPVEHVMRVSLGSGQIVDRYAGERRWQERQNAFGAEALPFWRWQERTADWMWDLALRLPNWPPKTARETSQLLSTGLNWLGGEFPDRLRPGLLADVFRPLAAHLPADCSLLRRFVDGQLLIAAQAASDRTYALYGAAALDLPRRGVIHLEGGIGAVAKTLVAAIRNYGGKVLFRQEASRIVRQGGQPVAVETGRKESFPADIVIANLPPENVRQLLGENPSGQPPAPGDGWGAFVVYVGIEESVLPASEPLHYQVLDQEGLAEGRSVFLSISPAWDTSRAPQARRAITMSTHTDLRPWWRLYRTDREAYEARKQAYTERLLSAAERVLPGIRQAAQLVLPGTPITFQRFTRRRWGWVGGYPQTHLLRSRPARLGRGLWLVGDSIFPGQSIPAVALGGLSVARSILTDWGDATTQNRPATRIHEEQFIG